MVIVAGSVTVEAKAREAYLAGLIDRMHTTRAEPGCLEYTYSADPSDPGRVMLIERWASQKDLDAHVAVALARPKSSGPAVAPLSASVFVYDVTAERPIGN